jgi:hypothetical protein
MRTTIKGRNGNSLDMMTGRRVRRYFTHDSTILGVDIHGNTSDCHSVLTAPLSLGTAMHLSLEEDHDELEQMLYVFKRPRSLISCKLKAELAYLRHVRRR